MADENATTQTTETPPVVKEAGPVEDPYAGLNESEKAAVLEAEQTWKALTPKQRATYHELAVEANQRRMAELNKPKEEPKSVKAAKKAAETDDDEPNPLDELRQELRSLRGELQQRQHQQTQAQFEAALAEELDRSEATREDLDARELVREACVARYAMESARNPGTTIDPKKLVNERVAKLESRDKKRGLKYVESKLETRRNAGEGPGGRVPATETVKYKPSDLEDGTHFRRMQEAARKRME